LHPGTAAEDLQQAAGRVQPPDFASPTLIPAGRGDPLRGPRSTGLSPFASAPPGRAAFLLDARPRGGVGDVFGGRQKTPSPAVNFRPVFPCMKC